MTINQYCHLCDRLAHEKRGNVYLCIECETKLEFWENLAGLFVGYICKCDLCLHYTTVK